LGRQKQLIQFLKRSGKLPKVFRAWDQPAEVPRQHSQLVGDL
jgi:hypothetical protein